MGRGRLHGSQQISGLRLGMLYECFPAGTHLPETYGLPRMARKKLVTENGENRAGMTREMMTNVEERAGDVSASWCQSRPGGAEVPQP